PCVSSTCVAPSAGPSHPPSRHGVPDRNGSIRIRASPLSMRKAECPYQVIFMGLCSSQYRRRQGRRLDYLVKGKRAHGVRNIVALQSPGASMTVAAVEDLPALLAPGATLASLDLGTKTIGLAVSDRGRSFAHPRQAITRKKFSHDAQALLEALKADQVGAVVVGLPVNMDGSEGPRAQASRAFVRNMERLTDLPFAFWDERLS